MGVYNTPVQSMTLSKKSVWFSQKWNIFFRWVWLTSKGGLHFFITFWMVWLNLMVPFKGGLFSRVSYN